jgi:DNA invertase Pin-like site-specific DNA recombinase
VLVGYARVSSVGQSLDVQLSRLAHCERIFQEKRSGTTDQRPELRACLSFVREGDTLVVTKLDRLARSTLHLCSIAEELARKQVQLEVLDQAIETRSPTGRLLFHLLAAIAEFETTLRSERQMEGISHAKARGVRFGRFHALTPSQGLCRKVGFWRPNPKIGSQKFKDLRVSTFLFSVICDRADYLPG